MLTYNAAKKLQGLKLTYDAHFGVPVNTSESVVHIPTEVYDKGNLSIMFAEELQITKM